MTAAIFILPLARRASRVRAVAARYSAMEGQTASRYWRQTVRAQGAALKRLGASDEQIRVELDGFRRAVEALLRMQDAHSDAGGAA